MNARSHTHGMPNPGTPEQALEKPGFAEEAIPCLDAVYRFALRLTRGDEVEAADTVQETFLRAYRGWHTYERGTRIHSWLFTICRNVVRRRKTIDGKRPDVAVSELGLEMDDALEVIGAPEAPGPWEEEKAFFDGMIDRTVLAAVDALPDEFRESIILKDMHDFSCSEIAETLGIPEGTVKSRLHRGRRILMRELRSYAEEIGFLESSEGREIRA